MTLHKKPYDDVFFSPAQLHYLESLYPYTVLNPANSEAQMRYYFGQQSVLDSIRRRTRGLNAKSYEPSTGRIPPPSE